MCVYYIVKIPIYKSNKVKDSQFLPKKERNFKAFRKAAIKRLAITMLGCALPQILNIFPRYSRMWQDLF